MEVSSVEIENVTAEEDTSLTFWEDKDLIFMLALFVFLVYHLLCARNPFDILKWIFLSLVMNLLGFFLLCYADQRPIHVEAMKSFERCQHFGIMDKMTQQVLMDCLNSKKMLEKGLLRITLAEFLGDLQTFLKYLIDLGTGVNFIFWLSCALIAVLVCITRIYFPTQPHAPPRSFSNRKREILEDPLF